MEQVKREDKGSGRVVIGNDVLCNKFRAITMSWSLYLDFPLQQQQIVG